MEDETVGEDDMALGIMAEGLRVSKPFDARNIEELKSVIKQQRTSLSGKSVHEEKDSINMMTVGSLGPEYDDAVAAMMIEQLGGSRSYVRERRQAMRRVILSEICSPPRVTKEIKHGRWRHILLGFALDLTVVDPTDGMPWDFSRRTKRERARDIMREQKPYVLIGSTG